MLDVVVVLHVHPGDALAPAVLHPVGGQRQRLDVAGLRDRDDHLLVGDQVLDVHVVFGVGDLRAPVVAVGLADLEQLLADEGHDARLVAEDLPQLADPLDEVGVVALDLVDLERRQPAQRHREDRLGLLAGQLELLDELRPRGLGVGRRANERDDLVEVGQRDQQALEDVCAGLGLAQLVLRAPHDHVALVVDVVVDDLEQRERPRHAVDERDRVHAERRLQHRVLVELVQHDLGDHVALELDHEPHARLVRLVAQVGDLGDLLVVDHLGDLLDHARAVVAAVALGDLVGQLGDDDRLLALAQRLDVRPRAHDDPAAPGLVRVLDPLPADDDAGGGEVGALDVLHQARGVDVRVVDVGDHRVDGLAQVVRRDVGGHAHRDARGAVDQQVGVARRQDERLEAAVRVVGTEVDGVGVEVAQHLGGQPREAGLRVAHGRGRVAVDGAEVALAVDQRVAHGEVLGEAHEGVVDGGVAVRVEVLHHLADDRGRLVVRPRGLEPGVVHRVQHAAVHRLEAVAHVGQRAPDDHAHRVVEVRRPHLLL